MRGAFVVAPSEPAVRLSRGVLVAATVFAVFETGRLYHRILADETIGISRFDWYSLTPVAAWGVLALWSIGSIGLLSDRWRARIGWLAPVGGVVAALLDRQTLAGEVIYLVVVFSLMHWLHAIVGARWPRVAGAPLRVIQWQISVVFAWTAIAKMNPLFLSGGILSVAFDGPLPWPDVLRGQRVLMLLAFATVVFEASLAVGFWIRGLRRPAVIAALVFHLFIVMFLSPTVALAAFALVMGTGYILFAVEPWATADREALPA